ncbi:MAG: type II secretion system protein [Candidatus Shapirobacteria bacterium]
MNIIKNKTGFTLIEIMIVFTIVAVLIVITVMTLNPIALQGRGNDARIKSDLNKIKIAFEEYNNDNNSYPMDIGASNTKDNCGKTIIKQLNSWPCKPGGGIYTINIGTSNNSQWFKVITVLSTGETYGVSSSNIKFTDSL